MTDSSIPVLTYHSIAGSEKIDFTLFETHLEVLKDSGLPSLLPRDLKTAQKGFLLTFDDGFADFWTHAFPLLEKYGIRATVFVIPQRTGDGDMRPRGRQAYAGNANKAHQEAGEHPGPHDGFLRWEELSAMEASGLVEIQSHSLSHRSIWRGDRIVSFNLGAANRTHWSLSQATDGDSRLGIPVYPRGSALAYRRYCDDPVLRDTLANWIETHGGKGYIDAQGVDAVTAGLWEQTKTYLKSSGGSGRWETPNERIERTGNEIAGARKILQDRLGGPRDELCLPWGTYDDLTLECARQAGIKRVYTLDRGINPAGKIGFCVNRFEPRPRGRLWLMTRLWIYRSVMRIRLYRFLSRR